MIYDRKVQEEQIARQKRIHEHAELNYGKAHLPSRMQKDVDRKARLPPKPDASTQYPHKPEINPPVTADMFKHMQRKFAEKIERKKS